MKHNKIVLWIIVIGWLLSNIISYTLYKTTGNIVSNVVWIIFCLIYFKIKEYQIIKRKNKIYKK